MPVLTSTLITQQKKVNENRLMQYIKIVSGKNLEKKEGPLTRKTT